MQKGVHSCESTEIAWLDPVTKPEYLAVILHAVLGTVLCSLYTFKCVLDSQRQHGSNDLKTRHKVTHKPGYLLLSPRILCRIMTGLGVNRLCVSTCSSLAVYMLTKWCT